MSELIPQESEFILYTNENGDVKLNVMVLDEAIWLTQESMQELFGRAKSTISEHISNVFKEGELQKEVVIRKFRTTTQHGAIADKTQQNWTNFYNLEVLMNMRFWKGKEPFQLFKPKLELYMNTINSIRPKR